MAERRTCSSRRTASPTRSTSTTYVEHGGTEVSARALGVPEHDVVKTLVMQDEDARPLIVLMHGDRKVSTKNLARQAGREAHRALQAGGRRSGTPATRSGGTSPFGTQEEAARCTWSARSSRCPRSTSTAGGAASWSASHPTRSCARSRRAGGRALED